MKDLSEYSYLPKDDTITKLKFYDGPYNQVKGFRKYMDLPKGFDWNELKSSNELWSWISQYILSGREGTLKKLPYRLETFDESTFELNKKIFDQSIQDELSRKDTKRVRREKFASWKAATLIDSRNAELKKVGRAASYGIQKSIENQDNDSFNENSSVNSQSSSFYLRRESTMDYTKLLKPLRQSSMFKRERKASLTPFVENNLDRSDSETVTDLNQTICLSLPPLAVEARAHKPKSKFLSLAEKRYSLGKPIGRFT